MLQLLEYSKRERFRNRSLGSHDNTKNKSGVSSQFPRTPPRWRHDAAARRDARKAAFFCLRSGKKGSPSSSDGRPKKAANPKILGPRGGNASQCPPLRVCASSAVHVGVRRGDRAIAGPAAMRASPPRDQRPRPWSVVRRRERPCGRRHG